MIVQKTETIQYDDENDVNIEDLPEEVQHLVHTLDEYRQDQENARLEYLKNQLAVQAMISQIKQAVDAHFEENNEDQDDGDHEQEHHAQQKKKDLQRKQQQKKK